MELSSVPLAIVHFWRVKRMHAELEKLTPGQLDGYAVVDETVIVKKKEAESGE